MGLLGGRAWRVGIGVFAVVLTFLRGGQAAGETRVVTRPPLVLGQIVEDQLAPEEIPSYPIRLDAGTFVRVVSINRDTQVNLRLIGPDQRVLHEHEGSLQNTVFWVAQTAGDYRVEVIGVTPPRIPVRYAIALKEIRARELLDQKRLAAQRLDDQAARKGGSESARREALDAYQRERALWREVGEGALEAWALIAIAGQEYFLGDLAQVGPHSDEARALARQAGDRFVEAEALAHKARYLIVVGRIQEAIDAHEEAIEMYRALGDRKGEHVNLIALAGEYNRLGDFEHAVELEKAVLRFAREIGEKEGEVTVLNTLSVSLEELGQLAEALKFARLATEVGRGENLESFEASALRRLGTVQFRMRQMREAIDSFQRSLAITEKIGNRWFQAVTRLPLASTYVASGQFARGRELLETTVLELRALGDRGGELQALYELARVESRLGNRAAALKHVDAALDLEEATRRELIRDDWRGSFVATKRKSYELAVDLRMAMHRTAPGKGFDSEALSVSERARARTLIELLERMGVTPEEGVDPEVLTRRREVESALKAHAERQLRLLAGEHTRAQVAAEEAESDRLTQELRQVNAKISSRARNASPDNFEILAGTEIGPRLLDGDTTLVEYWFGSEHSYAWIVTSSSMTAFELPPQRAVERVARRAYAQLKSPRGETEGLTALGQMLVNPVAKHLKGKRLAVVADGVLQYIPFGALPLPNGAPVISRFAVANLPSASTLAIVRRERSARPQASKLAAVLADPVYSKADPRVSGSHAAFRPPANLQRSMKDSGVIELNRLPATREEAAILRQLSEGEELLEAIGFEANRDTALSEGLANYRILHFATHGLVNSLHPELSGLVLSLVDPLGRPQDGFLQAHEIYRLRLGADLVVLSACQTALGKEIRGEGLMGLTRAFMAAGVPRVIASLWSVPDVATAELMKRFYRRVIEEKLAPSAALRKAQNFLRKEKRWAAPYFWAGFTLQGDWN